MVDINQRNKVRWFFRLNFSKLHRDVAKAMVASHKGFTEGVKRSKDFVLVNDDKLAQVLPDEAFALACICAFLARPVSGEILGAGEGVRVLLVEFLRLVHDFRFYASGDPCSKMMMKDHWMPIRKVVTCEEEKHDRREHEESFRQGS
jgi:hypothetical protein